MKKFYLLWSLIAFASGVMAADNPVTIWKEIDKISVWKLNYDAKHGLPKIQWRSSYPKLAVRMANIGKPVLSVWNDLTPKDAVCNFSVANKQLIKELKGQVVVDFIIRFTDFGHKKFVFMLILRLPDNQGVIRSFVLKLAPNRIWTPYGSTNMPAMQAGQACRFSLYADLATGNMVVYRDGNKINKGIIKSNPSLKKSQIIFGDGSRNIAGAFQLDYLRITNFYK